MELSHLYWHFGNLSVYKALNIPTTYEAFTKCAQGGEAGSQYRYLGNPRQNQFDL